MARLQEFPATVRSRSKGKQEVWQTAVPVSKLPDEK